MSKEKILRDQLKRPHLKPAFTKEARLLQRLIKHGFREKDPSGDSPRFLNAVASAGNLGNTDVTTNSRHETAKGVQSHIQVFISRLAPKKPK